MHEISRARRLWILCLIAVALVAVTLMLRARSDPPLSHLDLPPPGRWTFQAERLTQVEDGEKLARVLSLPYVSGSIAASGRDGVRFYDRDRAAEGLNLYVSGHAPEALLIDMQGDLVHRWRYPFEKAFPDKEPSDETAFFRRAHLFPDGDLLALFQGGGMVKLDRDSRLLWASDLPLYNHLFVRPDGSILSIAKTARRIPAIRPEPVLEDAIVTLGPDGSLRDRLSLIECFRNSEFWDLIHPLPDHADIFHSNTVLPIPEAIAEESPVFGPGNLLVSLREIDIVAVVDPVARTVTAAWRGPWRAQHQPILDALGNILLFDNQGADGNARVVKFDPARGELIWQYPGPEQPSLSSPEAGSCQILANGNILITESESGRAREIAANGDSVWLFSSPHRAGHRDELVATLFELTRIPRVELTFLPPEPTG